MAENTLSARLKHPRKTKNFWETTNPILYDGEVGFVSDENNIYKVGDGVTHWNDLPYASVGGGGGISIKLLPSGGTAENLEDNYDHVLLTEYTPSDPSEIA